MRINLAYNGLKGDSHSKYEKFIYDVKMLHVGCRLLRIFSKFSGSSMREKGALLCRVFSFLPAQSSNGGVVNVCVIGWTEVRCLCTYSTSTFANSRSRMLRIDKMVKRCVAAGCSNTNADGVSLYKFPNGSSKCKDSELSGQQRPILFSAVNILATIVF